jgi:6-phosphofructokinase 1
MNNGINALVAQSGGPTAVINSSLAGVIEECFKSNKINTVYGARFGIEGIFKDNIINLTELFQKDQGKLDCLKKTPSMFLGSCRYKLPGIDQADQEYRDILEKLRQYHIGYFFYIGGNDSMDTVAKLSKYFLEQQEDIKVIGIPKTIDNDLVEIDHTPGFGSAAKFIATSVLEMAHDTYIYNQDSVLIVEIMGRNAGWLTASSVLARNEYSSAPDLIYLPEVPFMAEQFIEDVRNRVASQKQVVIAVSEGIKDKDGTYISAKSAKTDSFGHVMLSGVGKYLENLVAEQIGCKARSVELNIMQRCASHIVSKTDQDEAEELGKNGVRLALNGNSGKMSTLRRNSDVPYVVSYGSISIDNIANHEKKIPLDWISPAGNDILPAMLTYLKPLVDGISDVHYQEGIPKYLYLK